MTLDEVIKQVESDMVDGSVIAVKAAMTAFIPELAAFFLTPFGNFLFNVFVSPVVKYVAKIIVKFFDNQGYYAYKTVVNNAAAGKYEDSIRASKDAVDSGDQNEIAKARAAQRAAFLALYPLTS